MGAIYKREMRAYFTSFIAYFFIASFFFFEGFLFYVLYSNGSTNVFAIPFNYPLYLTIFLIPVLTMKTMSEDRRQKVDQALLTAPVSVGGIVLGKFFACLSVFALSYAPTLIFQIIVSYHQDNNWMQYFYSLFGTMLLGGILIAIGIFISSLTESTTLSAVLSIVVNLLFVFMTQISEMIGVAWLTKATQYIAILDRYSNFGESIFSVPDVVYFLTLIAVFLFLCVRSVERRRWA